MPSTLSWLLLSTPACSPDANFTHLPPTSPPKHKRTESAPLLGEADTELDDCLQCSRKRRRLSFDAYPNQPSLSKHRNRPQERGCRRLLTRLKHLACCCTSRRRYQLLTRYEYHKQKKPFTAISVHVEQLTAETYDEDDLAGIPDLLEVVKLQGTGSQEVARALRKKLKYGSVHRQVRALTILDGLLQNGGQRLQRQLLADAPLQERLRIAAVDPVSDIDVRNKCKTLFGQWVASSREQPGLEGAKSLYNQLPKKQNAPAKRREQSKVLRENEEEARREEEATDRARSQSIGGPSSPQPPKKSSAVLPAITLSSASTFGTNKVKKDKKNKNKFFNLEKEKPAILQCIAGSSVASTNLNNALKLVNRESKRVSDDTEVMKRFETCKSLRRQILKYIQYVETEELLGGLIHANEELVNSLVAFEVLDKSLDDDSDSEMEEAAHLSRQEAKRGQSAMQEAEKSMAGLSVQNPPKPPRPNNIALPARPVANSKMKKVESDSDTDYDSEDSNDPFGDKNIAKTPDPSAKAGFTWREV